MSDFWRNRRVFVTGATGIVGSWLIDELLQSGAHVAALVRDDDQRSELFRSKAIERVAVVTGRLEDFWTLERAISEQEINTVFHLGAQTLVTTAVRSPFLTFEANVRGTYNLLEACRLHRDLVERVVIASSDKVYGDQDAVCLEEMDLKAQQPYEVSKCCVELVARAYHKTYGMPLAIARCGNIYGGSDLNWDRLIPETIRALLRREQPIIRSNGQFVRDYLYVKDATAAYRLLAMQVHDREVQGETFNFSPERPFKVLEVVELIKQLMGCPEIQPRILNQASGEIVTQSLSSAKAQRVLGWRPQWDLERGLAETIAWYETFFVETRTRSCERAGAAQTTGQ